MNISRRFPCVMSLVLLATTLFAGPVKNYNDLIDLKIDRVSGIYAKGETVTVDAVVDKALEGQKLELEVFENCKSVSKTVVPAVSGVVFTGSYDRTVSVMVRLAPVKNTKNETRIGFVVAPEGFRPGYDCPKDFRKFWKKQLKTMRALPMVSSVTPLDPKALNAAQKKKLDVFNVEVNCVGGMPASGCMAKPKDAEPKSLPIILYLHGAGVSGASSRVAANFAMKGDGCIAMDLNAHGIRNEQPKAYYDSLAAGPLKNYPGREVVDHETFYFRGMFLRAVRMLDFLTQDPCWNGKILVYGSSQGGAQTAAVAGLDKRVGAVVMLVPAMNDMCGDLAGHGNSWPVNRGAAGPGVPDVIKYYDGANFLRFYKGKLHFEVGLVDTTCPAANVFSSFNVAASPEKHIYTFPYRPHNEPGPRYYQSWKDNVEAVRNAYMDDFLTK